MGEAEDLIIRRVEHDGGLYVHATDMIDACRTIRDKSWKDGLCTAAMVMDSLCEVLSKVFHEKSELN